MPLGSVYNLSDCKRSPVVCFRASFHKNRYPLVVDPLQRIFTPIKALEVAPVYDLSRFRYANRCPLRLKLLQAVPSASISALSRARNCREASHIRALAARQ